MNTYYVYVLDYPEDGGLWFEADSADEAKRLYNAASGGPGYELPLDSLGAKQSRKSAQPS